MNVKEALIAARDKIIDPTSWTVDFMAINADDKMVSPFDKSAVCFCAVGSLRFVTNTPDNKKDQIDNPNRYIIYERTMSYLSEAAMKLFKTHYPTNVNDEIGHEAVIAMYNEAIRLVEKERGL